MWVKVLWMKVKQLSWNNTAVNGRNRLDGLTITDGDPMEGTNEPSEAISQVLVGVQLSL